MHTALTGAPAAWAPNHRLFIVNDENRWEIAGSYQIARCVKVPGRRALSVGNGHGWKASFAKAGVAGSNPAGDTAGGPRSCVFWRMPGYMRAISVVRRRTAALPLSAL